MGADAVELDVQRLGDGTLVTHHDDAVGGSRLADLGYASARRACLDRGYDLPTLAEVVRWSAGRIALDVELKHSGHEGRVLELLGGHLAAGAYVVKSFDHGVVRTCRHLAPTLGVGLLLGRGDPDPLLRTRWREAFPAPVLRTLRPTFVGPNHQLTAVPGYVRRLHRAGLPVWVWTVNDRRGIRAALRRGVDAIISDRPDLVREVLASEDR